MKPNKTLSFANPKQELDLFHLMIRQIGDEVMVIRHDGRIAFVNEATVRGLGFSRKYICSKKINSFLSDKISIKEWQKTRFAQLKKRKKPISFLLNRVVKGGKIQAIDVTAVYLKYNNDEYILSVARDITAQLALQKKLKESEDLYRRLNEQAGDGILTVDLIGNIVYANKAACALVKLSVQNVLGTHFAVYVERNSLTKAWKYFYGIRKGLPVARGEMNIVNSQKEIIPVEFTISPIYKSGKIFQIHAIIKDISRRRQLDNIIRETEKMKALQHFISGTALEIQHPLKAILDRTQGILEKYQNRNFEYIGYKEFKDIMASLETMRDQVKYSFNTTNRLISINKRKAGLKSNYCYVNSAIRESIKMVKDLLEFSDMKMTLKVAANLPAAAIGFTELSQVMINVLTNAIQAVPGHGHIKIRTTLLKKEDLVQIECEDDGVGIPEDILPRVFEPFFTTKQRGLEKSAGLGLSVVYSVINASKGNVVIKSSLREGTTVCMTLPVYHSPRRVN